MTLEPWKKIVEAKEAVEKPIVCVIGSILEERVSRRGQAVMLVV